MIKVQVNRPIYHAITCGTHTEFFNERGERITREQYQAYDASQHVEDEIEQARR